MKTTAHSEYDKLKKVYLKRPEEAFVNQQQINKQWKNLYYLSQPDYDRAIEEYQYFESILKRNKVNISFFSKSNYTNMDSIYCRDASIVTDFGVIICKMGKGQRDQEPQACAADYEIESIEILGQINFPGIIEGGDVAWLDYATLAVGHGYRSNEDGYKQLKKLLNPFGISLISVDLPHYKGANDVFHLMSIFSPVDKDIAVTYSPLMPVRFRNELLARGYQLIEVPDEEFESMGCNVLALSPGKCVMLEGNPRTKEKLEEAGCEVIEYSGQEISIKGGGGPTCLTRPIERVKDYINED